MLQFGTVPIGQQVIKPVELLNRTNETLYYAGATYGWPGASGMYPQGIWEWRGPSDADEFPCWTIAPKSACTMPFSFVPFAAGVLSYERFALTYATEGGTAYTSNPILMTGTGR